MIYYQDYANSLTNNMPTSLKLNEKIKTQPQCYPIRVLNF